MHRLSGNIVEGPMVGHMKEMMGLGFGAELIYAFVIILCGLIIYFSTKEIYELSSYKGIRYFRQSFLFFSLAFFFRVLLKFIIFYFDVRTIFTPFTFGLIGFLSQLLFIYFGVLAIFYLLASILCHSKLDISDYTFHIFALTVSILSVFLGSPLIFFLLNLIIFFLAVVSLFYSRKLQNKKVEWIYGIYFLLLVFWLLNIIDTLIPQFFRGFQFLIYLSSIVIFITILTKVLKKTGSN